MQNGTRKGGTLQTYQTLRSAPRLQDIWQLHWSYNGLLEQNPPGLFIANIDDPQVIANVLTSPPPSFGRGGGAPGGAPAAGAPPAGAPPAGAPPAGGGAPAAAAPSAGGPPAGGPPAGGPPAGGGGRPPAHTGPAFLIKIAANADGTFTVTNTRNGFSKTYK
jgi:hypothetical protein